MDLNIFFLNGYGQFVWPAFIFTFFVCLNLFTQSKKELKKYEKIFAFEYQQERTIKISKVSGKKSLSKSPIF